MQTLHTKPPLPSRDASLDTPSSPSPPAPQEAAAQGLTAPPAVPAPAPGGSEGGYEEGVAGLPDSELHHLRVVHHLR